MEPAELILPDNLPQEEPLELYVNGNLLAVLMRTPGMEKELAAGFCVGEGYLPSADEILVIHHCGTTLDAPTPTTSRNRITLHVNPDALRIHHPTSITRIIRSGCGSVDLAPLLDELPPVTSPLTLPRHILTQAGQTLRRSQPLYRQRGGLHAAALFTPDGSPLIIAEDIGRHNAVDKAIGYALLRRIPLNDKFLIATGRASSEIVLKATRVGIPIVASFSAATNLAVQLAHHAGLALIGYLRLDRMTPYTHPERITEQ